MSIRTVCTLALLGLLALHAQPAHAQWGYDPMELPRDRLAAPLDLKVPGARELPVRVYMPATMELAPIVLFSHGLGASATSNPYLGKHWSARGYVVVFVQHPGSDENTFKNVAEAEKANLTKTAESGPHSLARQKDIVTVLDQFATWNAAKKHPLFDRLDLKRLGMSGHGLGAGTTQALSGQHYHGRKADPTDARIKAAIIMSPVMPPADTVGVAFGEVKIPWLVMTGTADETPKAGAFGRLKLFPALPEADKYELVLDKGNHEGFTDFTRKVPNETRSLKHHRSILATSTAFWDAYLRDDKKARDWLKGEGVRTVLDKADRWQKK